MNKCLRIVFKVCKSDAVRMSVGRLFQAAGPATQNDRMSCRRLVRGTTRSPRAAERRGAGVVTEDTGIHSSCKKVPIRSLACTLTDRV